MNNSVAKFFVLAVIFCLVWALLSAPILQVMMAAALTFWVRGNVAPFKKKKEGKK